MSNFYITTFLEHRSIFYTGTCEDEAILTIIAVRTGVRLSEANSHRLSYPYCFRVRTFYIGPGRNNTKLREHNTEYYFIMRLYICSKNMLYIPSLLYTYVAFLRTIYYNQLKGC